jgi:putative MATE family efflux protein
MQGAALSTLISYFIALLIGYVLLRKRKLIDKISTYKFDKKILYHTVKIGLPVSLNGLAFSFIYVIVSRFVAEFGTTGLAAMGIGHRSEAISYQICVGLSLAATILVGQNIGAGNKDRAEKLSWRICGIGTLAMSIYGILLFVFARTVAEVFTTDLAVIDAAEHYNKINAVIMIFSAADVIFAGAFSGAGDTIPPVTIGLIFNTLRIPMCALFAPIWGLNGIWIAICLSVVLKSIVLTYWFYRGKWKERRFELSEKKENILKLVDGE